MNSNSELFSQRTILEILQTQATKHGAARAISGPSGQTISYAELYTVIQNLVTALQARGIERQTRVAIVMPNGFNIALALLAVSTAAIAVPLNSVYQAAELEAYFLEARVSHVLVQSGGTPAVRAVADKLGLPVISLHTDGVTLEAGANCQASAGVAHQVPLPDDTAMILLTSGSTGRPKKVPLTHRNLCAAAGNVSRSLGLNEHDTCLSMWEQHHIGGLVDLLLAPLISGGSVICAGSFDALRFYDGLATGQPTWFQGVPTTLRELLQMGRTRRHSLEKYPLRFLRSVAAALPPSQMAELEDFFGIPVIQTFGMTEAGPLITTNHLPPELRKPGSAGSPCGPEVVIFNPQGQPLPVDTHGEVAIRGENVFAGYEDDELANSQCFREGWFYTGDIGYFDSDGYLFLRGRVKEMINRGGEKVSPYEVEDVLARHPGVAQVAVFARTHPTLGEDVAAALVLRASHALSEADARMWVSTHLSAFKVPRTILYLDHLPRCPVGKVRRQDLVELANQAEKQKNRVQPSNALEEVIARLWASELNLSELGVEDDFVAIGGDSLSSVRILTATESLLGIRFSDDALEELTTVRRMANHILETGYTLVQIPSLDIETALLRAATQVAHEPIVGAQSVSNLATDLSIQNAKSMREALLNTQTPRELLSGVDAANHEQAWLTPIREEINQSPHALSWVRHALNPHSDLYTADGSAKPEQKTLIVGFTGRALRLMMPLYRFLLQLEPERFDVLLLRSVDRGHYETGVPGLGTNLHELGIGLHNWANAQGYRRRIAFGTSAGGLAALSVGLGQLWDRAIAVGADIPSSHPEIQAALKHVARADVDGGRSTAILMYAELNSRDSYAAQELKNLLPRAIHQVMRGVQAHNVLEIVHKRQELKAQLHALLEGDQ